MKPREESDMSKALVPEAKNGLSAFKNEVANELGVPFTDYNGNLTSRLKDGQYLERVISYGEFTARKVLKIYYSLKGKRCRVCISFSFTQNMVK